VTLIIPSCLRSILQLNDRVFRREKALDRSSSQMYLRCRVSNSSEVFMHNRNECDNRSRVDNTAQIVTIIRHHVS